MSFTVHDDLIKYRRIILSSAPTVFGMGVPQAQSGPGVNPHHYAITAAAAAAAAVTHPTFGYVKNAALGNVINTHRVRIMNKLLQ